MNLLPIKRLKKLLQNDRIFITEYHNQDQEHFHLWIIHSKGFYYYEVEVFIFLFDSMVGSVLNYASEIWQFHQANNVKVICNHFCCNVLRLGRNVPTSFLYGKLGYLPISILHKYIIIKYWLHIIYENLKLYMMLINFYVLMPLMPK